MKRQRSKNQQQSFRWGYLVISIPLLAAIGLLGYKIFNQAHQQKMIDDEIATLEATAERLNIENKELAGLNAYFNTTEFKEKEAKDKLNLVKEGEKVVLVKGASVEQEEKQAEKDGRAEVVMERSNVYWWWYYFFGLKE